MMWGIAILFGISVTGLTGVLLSAFHSGAEEYSGTYSRETAREFEDIFLFIPPKRIAEAGWAAAAVAFLGVFLTLGDLSSVSGLLLGTTLGGIAGALGLRLPRWILSALRHRRLKRFNEQLVDTLANMSNALKAGFSITQAFESVVSNGENPIAQEFGLFLQQTRLGVNFSEAMHNLDTRVGSEDLTLVCMSIETARKTGGNLTEIFEKIASTIRERMRIEGRIRTLTAQGRLQGIIVGAMPVIIGLALMIVDPEMMMPFLRSPLGLGIIIADIVLVACGGLIIRKIINIDI